MRSKYLEESEIKKLRQALGKEAFLPLWVSLETGLRIGDVVSLKCSEVKQDGIHYKAAKTKKRGIAPISASLRRELNKRGKWLFPSPYKEGEHLTRQAVWARIKTAARQCDIDVEGVSPHSMRKAFAVETYRKKGFEAVKEALQHTHSSTAEIYAFADWNTGNNAEEPLKRRDLHLIVKMVLEAIGKEKTDG